MFCRNCGNEIPDDAVVCMHCGFAAGSGSAFCAHCGRPVAEGQAVCVNCGFPIGPAKTASSRSRLAAGLLGIFLGGWGVHNFYLGNTKRGILQIVLTVVTCGAASIWGLVEGILILARAEKFRTDADGNELQD